MKMWGWGGGGRESSRGRVRGTQGRFFLVVLLALLRQRVMFCLRQWSASGLECGIVVTISSKYNIAACTDPKNSSTSVSRFCFGISFSRIKLEEIELKVLFLNSHGSISNV